MANKRKIRRIGILTAGGDSPGLNAAIRAVGKACVGEYGIEVMGIYDGFRGLIDKHARPMALDDFSGILTVGGTILGTGRDKPEKMRMPDGTVRDMTADALRSYEEMGLDCLVCLGGGGTQRNALHLMQAGMDVVTLPKTIDNDIHGTDVSFGFDTAVSIATEAIDRLHSTAESHQRIMVLELMGNQTGWITLAAGVAGGADVILIPELQYDPAIVAESILCRSRRGKRFSIVAVAEGVFPAAEAAEAKRAGTQLPKRDRRTEGPGSIVARELAQMTGIETRETVLGYVQRGGTPTARDRILATAVGTRCAELLARGKTGFLVACKGDECRPVPLEEVAGKRNLVPADHPLIESARAVGICMGDEL
ncbi:6-phosphofructokinase [bacterium]|nr:6-phosphofructokinase [bacterium]